MIKLAVNILLLSVSILNLKLEYDKNLERYRKSMETLFKATRTERIVQNVRNGYGILNNQLIHFCNDQFCQTLGAKTKA